MIGASGKAKTLVFAIFLLGIGAGVLGANLYTTRMVSAPAPITPDRNQGARRDINKFYDYLGLNQDQREQMHKIGEETIHSFQDLRKETQPRFEAIQEASRVKIRAVLDNEQRKKYDDFLEKRRKNRDLNKNSNGNNKDRDSGSDHGAKSN
ncbi:MAG TPA: hypothetical protein VGK48_07565 [Terriglobia bacterium]